MIYSFKLCMYVGFVYKITFCSKLFKTDTSKFNFAIQNLYGLTTIGFLSCF